jgi:cyclic-di-AMP phosphodiesterase PgpH
MARSRERKTRPPAARGGAAGWSGHLVKVAVQYWQRLLEVPAIWLTLFLLLCTWSLLPRGLLFVRQVEAGAIADHDYVAPEDLLLPDEETTRKRQDLARDEVPPVYDFEVSSDLGGQLADLFAKGRQLLAPAGGTPKKAPRKGAVSEELTDALMAASPLKLDRDQAVLFFRKEFSPELLDRLQGLASQVLRQGVVENKDLLLENRMGGITIRTLGSDSERHSVDLYDFLAYPEEVRELVESEIRDWVGLSASERRTLASFLVANLPPNLFPNRSETLVRREAAATATPTSFNQIRKGQVIVRKGDEISEAAARQISSYLHGGSPLRGRVLPPLGTFLLLALAALVVWLALREERVADHSRRRLFGEALLLLTVSILGAKLNFVIADALAAAFESGPLAVMRSYLYAVPFAALALCAVLLLGRQAALVLSAIFSLLVSRLIGADAEALWVVIYSLAGSLAAIYAIDRYQVKQRLVLTRVGIVVGAVDVAVVLMLQALAGGGEGNLAELGFALVCAFGGGLLVAAVASFAVPIFEAVLSISTDIKLAELANTNLPLLRRLAFEAPGSFQHSLMVANLAKQASEAIAADAALAYTGSLYHDIGKIFRSEYFIENQRSGHNPHDHLQPTMSALILTSHIKDGLELARQQHLPQSLLDAIEQHHGTRLIKFFYNRALEQRERGAGEVSEEEFRYPGPKPQNKVMGVLMLADGVEAASRTLVEPSSTKIRTLIRTIVEDCLHDGQLDETDLTLSDLRLIAETFFRVLTNIFHHRVDYPGFDFNAEPGERRESPLAAAGAGRG